MPIIRPDDAPLEEPDEVHPVLGAYSARLLSDAGGLTQFGAFTETLPPGSRSSLRHWHKTEDEFIFMISGEVTLHEGDEATIIIPGEAACFKAGAPKGHFLENISAADATYLVVGTRADSDVVTYPDHDRVLSFDRKTETRVYTTLDGKPAGSPY